MVMSVTSLTQNGVRDWLIQRGSAAIMVAYVLVMLIFFVTHPSVTYDQWRALFACSYMRYFNVLFLVSMLAHAWIGMWTVFTDYIKCSRLRLFLCVLLAISLLGLLIKGLTIFWSV